ncbi:hypothetical protein DFQ28_010083 [Apophysomyces sp. BC1034]|nr:hypothetical protein DFQ29_008547 [Apophysomyces sp. BC1021]KAG0185023.1 hypothetical protein DFQ28_010083 [Apophysomyces sp. BC1034]
MTPSNDLPENEVIAEVLKRTLSDCNSIQTVTTQSTESTWDEDEDSALARDEEVERNTRARQENTIGEKWLLKDEIGCEDHTASPFLPI